MLRTLASVSSLSHAAVLDILLHWITYFWADFAGESALLAEIVALVDTPNGVYVCMHRCRRLCMYAFIYVYIYGKHETHEITLKKCKIFSSPLMLTFAIPDLIHSLPPPLLPFTIGLLL